MPEITPEEISSMIQAELTSALESFANEQLTKMQDALDDFAANKLPNQVKDLISNNLSIGVGATFNHGNKFEVSAQLSYAGGEISGSIKAVII